MQPPVLRVGNLDAQRDFTDVADIVAAYVQVIKKSSELSVGEIFKGCICEKR